MGRPGRGQQEGGKGLRAFRPGEAPGPQGTPSTFKEASSTTAPQPQTRCAPGEAPRAEPARPSLPPPARDTGPTPGPPSGHPAPTTAGASPLRAHPARPPRAASPHPTLTAAARPGPRLPASRTPPSPAVPGAPAAPPPAPAPPSPYPAPSQRRRPLWHRRPRGPRPADAALTVSPAQLASAHTLQPRPATSAPRRPEPPPSARDSPGHPRTDPHTGAIFRRQAPARPELVPAAARAHYGSGPRCPSASLAIPPFPSAPSFPLRFLFTADLSSRWVLECLDGKDEGAGKECHSRSKALLHKDARGGLCFSGWVRRRITRHRKEMTAVWRRGYRLELASL